MSICHIPIAELPRHLPPQIDILLCCASYEARCLSIPVAVAGVVSHHAIVAHHVNLAAHVGKNKDALCTLFGARALPAAMDSTNPVRTADAIGHALKDVMDAIPSKPRSVFVDTTTFTHESLLILMRTLQAQLRSGDVVLMGYAGAADYDPGQHDLKKWLSAGVEEVRSILGYSGRILPSRKSHLVVLVGFEHERAAELVEAFEPSRLSLGYGKPGTATGPKHEAANQQFHQLLSAMVAKYAPVESFEFSCSDPWEAKAAVLERVRLHPEYNAIVAPMNTKVSTVGCALAAYEHDDIQLCYAQPASYNYANYSSPGSTCYLWDMSAALREPHSD